MLQGVIAALRMSREKERSAGKAWAQGVIQRDGLAALKARLEEARVMGWDRRAFDEGVIEALREADQPH